MVVSEADCEADLGEFFFQFSSSLAMFSALDAYVDDAAAAGVGDGLMRDWRSVRTLLNGFKSDELLLLLLLSRTTSLLEDLSSERASQRACLAM